MARWLVAFASLALVACGAILGIDPLDVNAHDAGLTVDATPTREASAPDVDLEPEPVIDAGPDCAVVGPVGPTEIDQIATEGLGETWATATPDTLGAEDGTGATNHDQYTDPTGNGQLLSRTLLAHGFNLGIPPTATITSVVFDVRAGATTGDVLDRHVQLTSAALDGGLDLASTAHYGTSLARRAYGGSSATWGTDLTPDLVNRADFGVAYSTQRNAVTSFTTFTLDALRVTVTFCQ